jgi:hypothetical protein
VADVEGAGGVQRKHVTRWLRILILDRPATRSSLPREAAVELYFLAGGSMEIQCPDGPTPIARRYALRLDDHDDLTVRSQDDAATRV